MEKKELFRIMAAADGSMLRELIRFSLGSTLIFRKIWCQRCEGAC